MAGLRPVPGIPQTMASIAENGEDWIFSLEDQLERLILLRLSQTFAALTSSRTLPFSDCHSEIRT